MNEESSSSDDQPAEGDSAPAAESTDEAVAESVESVSQWWPLLVIREPVPVWLRWILGSLPILFILALWWWATGDGPAEERVLTPIILPSPLEVVRSFPSLWFDRALMLNLLTSLKEEIGDLDRVRRVVKLLCMINSAPDFEDTPRVANGASDLLIELYGEAGRHARSAVGMATLPSGMPVEIEMIVEVEG